MEKPQKSTLLVWKYVCFWIIFTKQLKCKETLQKMLMNLVLKA